MQVVHDAVFPASDFDVPTGQSVQAPATVSSVAPALANLPAGHTFVVNVVHDDAPASEYVPEAQVPVHAADSVDCPVAVPYLPAAQGVHEVWPVED